MRAVVDLLDEGPREQVREALSQVQVLYARDAGDGGPGEAGEAAAAVTAQPPPPESAGAEPPPRLWTPGSP